MSVTWFGLDPEPRVLDAAAPLSSLVTAQLLMNCVTDAAGSSGNSRV